MENLQNEYGNTIRPGLCVVKYFVLQSHEAADFRKRLYK